MKVSMTREEEHDVLAQRLQLGFQKWLSLSYGIT